MDARNFNDYLVKIFIMGDSLCGKSCLLNSYSSGSPLSLSGDMKYTWPDFTLVSNYKSKPLKLKLVIGDENELKRIKQIEFNDIFIICFSIDSPESFLNVQKWNIEIRKILQNPNIILVGTKIDLRKSKEGGASIPFITTDMGIEKAKEINAIKYMESSSLTYTGTKEIFDECINQYFVKKCYLPDLKKKGSSANFKFQKKNSTSNKRSSCKTQ